MGHITVPPRTSEPRGASPSKPAEGKRSGVIAPVGDLESARAAGKYGAWGAFVCAGATALLATLAASTPDATESLGVDSSAFIDAAMFLALGIGIWRMSRTCAVAGLVLYLIERVYIVAQNPANAGKGVIMMVLLIIAFTNGVRGTFAFHRLKKSHSSLPGSPARVAEV